MWQTDLQKTLAACSFYAHVAIIGMGNSLRSDDRVGLLAARYVRMQLIGRSRFMVIHDNPENHLGRLRYFYPQVVLFIDAADVGAAPGTFHWIPIDHMYRSALTAHAFSPSLVAHYLINEFECKVGCLGIQPASISFGRKISPLVHAGLRQNLPELIHILDPLLHKV